MIKIFEAFSGYGSQSLALKYANIEHEIVGISEIDNYAIKAHQVLHGDVKNFGDISKIKSSDIPKHDLFTYSFPCQDISASGKNASFEKGSGTRSSLLWECERLIKDNKSKYLMMENVKNIINKNHIHYFLMWIKTLEGLGYKNYYDIYNSKEHGIPQNRERVFMISILGEGEYSKPLPREEGLSLADMLEIVVDDKLYVDTVCRMSNVQNVAEIVDLTTMCPSFIYKGKNTINTPCIVASRGRNPQNTSSRTSGLPTVQVLEPNLKGVCNTLTTVLKDNYVLTKEGKVRNLSNREYFRFMGVKDEDINKLLSSGIPSTELYKMAGNSIVVNVMEDIFKNLLLIEDKGC